PLMICDPEKADPELRDFFTLRRAHWPFVMENTQRAWHWEAAYPQPYGYTDNPSVPEQVNVSVAQNLRMSDGKVTNMSSGEARGRNFHDRARDTSPGAVNHGYNFAEQWQRAFELDPPFVMITGWNEWIAGRFQEWSRYRESDCYFPGGLFVDQYNQEYSRDCEPMRGGHTDNYYYQLASWVRRFKGVRPPPAPSGPTAIVIDGSFADWEDVRPEFRDTIGDVTHRDHPGYGGLHYRNTTGRNDFVIAKAAHDQDAVSFLVGTRAPITPRTDPHWMLLLIDCDQRADTGWLGYDFVVNLEVPDATTTTVKRWR
ncbi:MAG: hypothetical protein KDM81_21400, partial [Verrucomicrobiae bacterium]|nr:hypothetical protein [Verrucomicrobiae bacterium]